GTHRIISSDVHFSNLGLVIVDEEQRFGVRVKEKIRAFRAGVDCLTLSATPIPRTLYLALMGGRDLSIIATPPQDRLPIKTHVGEEDAEKTKNALLRELARDGQALVIHNRVETIYGVADRLRQDLPQARIGVAHGQMSGDELDTIFHAFRTGKIQILVATTLVENGLDVPNANTIIVERADRHGLADLYQMRGRVGRWNRRAYAYFLTSKKRPPSAVSKERLDVLEQLGPHGGGFKVAMRDLEIRGGGSILGTEQSGHVSAIGFNLYCKMLKRMVQSLQGKTPHTLTEVKLEFPQRAYLPEHYIPESTLRLEFYSRFGDAPTEADVDDLFDELKDRFGTPPEEALWFYHLMRIRTVASRFQITALKLEKSTLSIEKRESHRKLMLPKIEGPAHLEELVTKAIS
ncbi:MAG: helicase-related protein, partial [Candidatus Obscuribacterales bacterium]